MEQQTWPDLIYAVAPQFNEIADRHKQVAWAEEAQFAIQAIQKNQKLAECMPHTVQNAVINVASVGLTLNPAMGYAYLVPEAVKQSNNKYAQECMLRVSFKGLLKIATDSGSIKWAKAEIVRTNDRFEYRGVCTAPEHVMNPFSDRGEVVGAYCVAKTHDGDFLVDVMNMQEIQKIKGAAKIKMVWDSWFDEMIKKAIIKRASKQWPRTDRADRLDYAVAALNEMEGSQEKEVSGWSKPIETISESEKQEILSLLDQSGLNLSMFLLRAGIENLDDLARQRLPGSINWIRKQPRGLEKTQ